MRTRADKDGTAVIIQYKSFGTISIKNLMQALWEDLQALGDLHNVEFVNGASFTIPVTNAYGDPVMVRHLDGRPMRRIDTHYYRPACLDFKL